MFLFSTGPSWYHVFRAGVGQTREKCNRHKISTADHASRELPLSHARDVMGKIDKSKPCVNMSECAACVLSIYRFTQWIAAHSTPDSKVLGANMGPIWGRQDPCGPHVGPMNLAIWDSNQYIQYSFIANRTCNISLWFGKMLHGIQHFVNTF